MGRLVDAEKLMKTIMSLEMWNVPDFVYESINNAPTVDAEPIRHGHWIGKEDQKWHCSECDGIAPKGYRYNYCPHCGAKMDEHIDTPTDPVAK